MPSLKKPAMRSVHNKLPLDTITSYNCYTTLAFFLHEIAEKFTCSLLDLLSHFFCKNCLILCFSAWRLHDGAAVQLYFLAGTWSP